MIDQRLALGDSERRRSIAAHSAGCAPTADVATDTHERKTYRAHEYVCHDRGTSAVRESRVRLGIAASDAPASASAFRPALACLGDTSTWLSLSPGTRAAGRPGLAIGTLDWNTFRVLLPLVECGVVILPRTSLTRHLAKLRELLAADPVLPLVVVTDRSLPRDVVRALRSRGALAALPVEHGEVWAAAQHASTRSLLTSAATVFRLTSKMPAGIGEALANVTVDETHPLSMTATVRGAALHRRTLSRAWHSSPLGQSGISLDDVLDALLTFRAFVARAPDESWEVVAARLGVHRHTLARSVALWAGVQLPDFSADAVRQARSAFARAVLNRLLAGGQSSGA